MSSGGGTAGALVGRRFGKYELLAPMAVGGTAEIYLARIAGEAGFLKFVVIKCLLDHLADEQDYVRMFLDEARLGAQLDHSNIVQTLELGQDEGRFYLVMEYLAGMSLAMMSRKVLARVPGGLPVEIILCLAAQACAGLHYAHERSTTDGTHIGLVHRDVSPQNLVVSFDGVLKIVDFGIAKTALQQTQTKSGTIKGKFAYMSPEQCLGNPIDRRTDIFALGTIVHELLTGRRLFKRESTYATYQAIVQGTVPPPSTFNHHLDPMLDEVVLKALAYDKQDRHPTAEAFGEALLGVLYRRGVSVSAADVARFMEEHFQPELENHAQQMRMLMEGHKTALSDMAWDSTDGDSDAAVQMPDDDPVGDVVDDPLEMPDEDEDSRGGTTVEANPLLRAQQLHAAEQARQRAETVPAMARSTRPMAAVRPGLDTVTEADPLPNLPTAVGPVAREARTSGPQPAAAPPAAGPGAREARASAARAAAQPLPPPPGFVATAAAPASEPGRAASRPPAARGAERPTTPLGERRTERRQDATAFERPAGSPAERGADSAAERQVTPVPRSEHKSAPRPAMPPPPPPLDASRRTMSMPAVPAPPRAPTRLSARLAASPVPMPGGAPGSPTPADRAAALQSETAAAAQPMQAPPTLPLRVSAQQPVGAFPPIATPTAFRARAAPIEDGFVPSPDGMPAPAPGAPVEPAMSMPSGMPLQGMPGMPLQGMPGMPLQGVPPPPGYLAAPEGYLAGPGGFLPASGATMPALGDLMALAQERSGRQDRASRALLAIWFLLALAFGVGVTLAVASFAR
jgi:serine/threonine-protein kinase